MFTYRKTCLLVTSTHGIILLLFQQCQCYIEDKLCVVLSLLFVIRWDALPHKHMFGLELCRRRSAIYELSRVPKKFVRPLSNKKVATFVNIKQIVRWYLLYFWWELYWKCIRIENINKTRKPAGFFIGRGLLVNIWTTIAPIIMLWCSGAYYERKWVEWQTERLAMIQNGSSCFLNSLFELILLTRIVVQGMWNVTGSAIKTFLHVSVPFFLNINIDGIFCEDRKSGKVRFVLFFSHVRSNILTWMDTRFLLLSELSFMSMWR